MSRKVHSGDPEAQCFHAINGNDNTRYGVREAVTCEHCLRIIADVEHADYLASRRALATDSELFEMDGKE